jgi:hypothetical protein
LGSTTVQCSPPSARRCAPRAEGAPGRRAIPGRVPGEAAHARCLLGALVPDILQRQEGMQVAREAASFLAVQGFVAEQASQRALRAA